VTEPTGHPCPECGAPRGVDNTPSCGCGQRVSEALRDARTAEAAAAEDFDPLRIRPYVELEGESQPPTAVTEAAAEMTMPLRAVAPAPESSAAVDATAAPPTPPAPRSTAPSARDLRLFDGTAPDAGMPAARPEAPRRRRSRTVLLGIAGAGVTVLAAAGLASGLFAYEAPSRDTALPDDIRASVPDAPTSETPTGPSPAATTPTGRRPAPAPAPTSASPSASPSPSRPSASPTPSTSEEPTKVPSTARATATVEPPDTARETTPPVLRRGSRGAEVTELELRLTQLGLYPREATGNYNEGVEDAVTRYQQARGVQVEEYGVYDLETRQRLESETREP
jgi:hypothetical protein